MAVMSLRWLAAAAVCVPAVSAGMGREHVAAGGPIQTPAPKLKDAGVHLTPRVLTARPAARALLQKRDTNTCGYVDGNSRSNYVCANSAAQCLYNTEASAVGCCLTTDCLIYTACLPYASTDVTTRTDFDSERTRVCTDSDLPSCAVFSYADPSGSLSGFTIPTCDTAAKTYTMYFTPTGGESSSARETSAAEDAESSTAAAAESSSSETSSPTDDDDGNQSPAETSAATSQDPETGAPSSTPVGPIVGGVVGGVAALGLLGLGIFFLLRRKNKNKPPSPAMTAAHAGPPGGPGFMGGPPGGPHGLAPPYGSPNPQQPTPPPDMAAMAAVGAGAGAGAYDPRYSMAKPPASPVHPMHPSQMSPHMSVSPSGSPAPVYPPHMQGTPPPQHPYPQQQQQQPYNMGPTPPPPQNGGYVPYPGPPMPQQQQHAAVELPTQRGDGQVHELS
ncbi:hypothetical protein F5144DRAFT_396976 [Chaetomium tenue]|uniref:Uncharacterized protein n=1 Tax=Chaetomium tenue TaxID=1854479 RepID=A0ACB7NVN4_9PEZI|nr:hypothetical protein F5144DRAFT_396976 [Chaetomium globosum]